ncbi:2'-5' RNA ligase family protein [Hymenobacter pini]|uniref:2'-5' RNA ligase family protein n=1 Tax=Hymenobacter pini TaxID=2880879 RepID=UPI001CF58418|nr:2'-5' RNA ligase family protein [Hymenobacter pini]MCA8830901.1 2'-5' RNA ligase family protein [Hymenobacter pini]
MTPSSEVAPLILTLTLEAEAHQHFTRLRQQYFPPERNYLEAHVTLFHHLPGLEQAAVLAQLRQVAATTPPLELLVSGVRFLGRGVAYTLESSALQHLHRQLQHDWANWLTPQDRQPLRPHITVQNKVAPEAARAVHAQLQATFAPATVQGTGFTLWTYCGGPWQEIQQIPFVSSV